MTKITLEDILIGAEQEAFSLRHFYIGAEHLFLALLSMRHSITSTIIQEYGFTPEYVRDIIRRKAGKGTRDRSRVELTHTPRLNIILDIANELALESGVLTGDSRVDERDLLIAFFEEQQSLPIRVLGRLGINDLTKLLDRVRTYDVDEDSYQPFIRVEYGPQFDRQTLLNKEYLALLRKMFFGYSYVRVERRLRGGYTNAVVVIVTPIQNDNREDAAVAVKLGEVNRILDEAQRYELYVKNKLPALTARIEEKPTILETKGIAGLKYTLISNGDHAPRDLRLMFDVWSTEQIGEWLQKELFQTFGRNLWQQKQSYQFPVWREYDRLLPPILTLEYVENPPNDAEKLRMPINRASLHQLDYGDVVVLERFLVHRVNVEKNSLDLIVSERNMALYAFKVEVRGIDLQQHVHYQGELIEEIGGTVWQKRDQRLIETVNFLGAEFELKASRFLIDIGIWLPNPLIYYEEILDQQITGGLSTIHADLHPGNILIGPHNSAFLIDFAHTRDGHTMLDWATLEVSLLCDYVAPLVGEEWGDLYPFILTMMRLNRSEVNENDHIYMKHNHLQIVKYIRQIVAECLVKSNNWIEYHIALLFCSLRAMERETVNKGGKRLMLLIAALAVYEIRARHKPNPLMTNTALSDDTELI
jgi:hypothetical protein